jgi:adenosylcobinamide-phosphate synthase
VASGSPARTRSSKGIRSFSRFIRTGKNSRAAAALLLEAAFGYPDGLYRRAGHPVSWVGALIGTLERELNRPETSEARRRAWGVVTCGAVFACGWGFGRALERLAVRLRIPAALLATPGLAQRSLHDHVAAVQAPLRRGDLAKARAALSQIVGRDVDSLDEAGVSAAALESLAESFNDGVVAPAFWLAVAGLPGLYAYKALNTADSLIGHREPRWRAFGWASARADDLANLVPARLAGALLALAGGLAGLRLGLRPRRRPRQPRPRAPGRRAARPGRRRRVEDHAP